MAANLTHLASVDQTPGGADLVWLTIGDKSFRCGRRTAAHLESTYAAFEKRFPDLHLHIAQTCYHDGYEPSAGTHDGDGVFDWYVQRKDGGYVSATLYWTVQKFMRLQGWDIWFRHTGIWADPSEWHLHGISEGCPGPVGEFIPGQDTGYKNHRMGLARSVDTADPSYFPGDAPGRVGTVADILALRFDFEAWEEDHMDEKTKDDIADRAARKTVDLLLGTEIGSVSKLTIKQILGKAKTFLTRK